MDFLELADQVHRREPLDPESSSEGSAEHDASRAASVEAFTDMERYVKRLGLSRDEEMASVVAITGLGLDLKNFGAGGPDDDDEDEDGKPKKSLPERIFDWFLKKLVKKVALTGARIIIESLWSVVRWFAEEVVVNGLRMAGEFLLRSVLLEGVGFLVTNPVGWGILGAAGVAAVGYWIYKRFFSDSAVPAGSLEEAKADYQSFQENENAPAYNPNAQNFVMPSTTTQAPTQAKPAEPARVPPPSEMPTAQPAPQQPAGAPRAAGPPSPPRPLPPVQPVGGSSLEDYVRPMIARHEGRKNQPYKDSRGLWTIGIGHLIGNGKSLPPEFSRTFSDQEIDDLFKQDFDFHESAARTIPNFDRLNLQGQAALVDITFNMGPVWWKPHRNPDGSQNPGWPRFRAAMEGFDIGAAAYSLMSSAWYSQVGRRSKEDIDLLKTNITSGAEASQPSTTTPMQGQPTSQAASAPPTGPGAAPGQTVKTADANIVKGPRGQPMRLN